MASTMDLLNEVLSHLQQKYNQVNQLMELTKELERAANSNDSVSFGMVLEMRQKIMNGVDKLDRRNLEIAGALPTELQARVKQMLRPTGEPIHLSNPLETNIFDTNKRILALLQKVSVLDDSIFRRIGGV